MTTKERQRLAKALRLLSEPTGDKNKGWELLRELAGAKPGKYSSPFAHPKTEAPVQKAETEYSD